MRLFLSIAAAGALAAGTLAAGTLAACTSAPEGPVAETGTLQNGDATLTSGEYADRFTVRLTQGQWLRTTLDSDAFDPYLVVRFPNGQQSDLDDSATGDTTTVTMTIQAQEAGQFEIIATSFRPGAGGAYRLVYEVFDAEPPADGAATPPEAPSDGDETPSAAPAEDGTESIEEKADEGASPAVPGDATLDA